MFVYRLLQPLRTPTIDSVMIAITELGDAQVLLPVILIALAWFLVHRLWLTAVYWLIAIGVAEVLTKVLKIALHRPRPGSLYAGIEQFSFPSGHATMSIVVYGFLALLLSRAAPSRFRKAVVTLAVVTLAGVLIGLIALSRLYLGAHWLSDVLGGLSFGAAWIAALAVAYEYRSHERFWPVRLAMLMLATFVVAGGNHVVSSHRADRLHYAPINPAAIPMTTV